MPTLKCEHPGCTKEVQEDDKNPMKALQLLQLHDTQAHSIANKPEKPRCPILAMPGDAVEDKDWERFVFQFQHNKKLAGFVTDSSSHVLEF